MNSFIHDDVTKDDSGILTFNSVYKYRLGPTNDEGFYRGQCRFSKTGIEWGNFYNIIDSNWENDFPNDEIIINPNFKSDKRLNHFLFYFRDETFECIAISCELKIKKTL